ncbi:acetyl/propionyl/methylcrotonyl-CoA carboxylase subunit alpha [Sabulicella glaciei]|uniref:Biotin/lipoyl-binding protein n=1 Tax=Sabulicella glaciei TaxID=2984948 RepID=A0ABT3NRA7_9PROT|nr:biotin carboxylase N-terminal domain-containing protein [Roseococcus sp. MDT2-1-1]MCW8084694.1 biotin/lipoyl-binding protein [Roseococcus sp. MDT2-1-1]
MFRTLLIANRGEIAVRITRTARRLGCRVIALYSEADRHALHVEVADEAHCIGPAPAAESYLRAEAILEVARRTGADAIHPGYGFLSENAAFAEACAAAGITFVGPGPGAIRAMGSKAESKRLMVAAGVPTVPGYHGEDQSDAVLEAEARRIGFPVLIKASAGGGGKGMRPAQRPEDFVAELAGARREAEAAFGDARVLLERYLARPRHVEVQVLGDTHGRIVHLHTRDCSVQRRHQKVLEEAPAPALPEALRDRLHEAAVNAARAVGYVNAGTVEFIVEADEAYFLEMNTRLQVEHPVTEMVTGLDLVEWQLRVASGDTLPSDLPPAPKGHAVEVRLYAEDAAQDFRPSTGQIARLEVPEGKGLRLDAGFRTGDAVTSFYDPMLAKLIAWGEDRDAALDRLAEALEAASLEGFATNLPFLRRLARHPALRALELDTGFITRHAEALLAAQRPMPAPLLAAALAWPRAREVSGPWNRQDGFRLQGVAERVEHWSDGIATHALTVRRSPSGVMLDGVAPDASGARLTVEGDVLRVIRPGEAWRLELVETPSSGSEAGDAGTLLAPIPGRLVQLLVAAGDKVAEGQLLAVMEAMKTELKFHAPFAGRIEAVPHAPGDAVEEGEALVLLTPAA